MRIGKGWLFASTFLLAASAQAMTADELVAKNVAARGGAESLQAIKSLRLSGKMILGGFGAEIDAVQVFKRPGSYRFEGTLQGMTMVQSYDGKEAWRILKERRGPCSLRANVRLQAIQRRPSSSRRSIRRPRSRSRWRSTSIMTLKVRPSAPISSPLVTGTRAAS